MVILKVPWDGGGGEKSAGAQFGPDAIERKFRHWPWRVAEDGMPHVSVEFRAAPDLIWASSGGTLGSLLDKSEKSAIVLSGSNDCSYWTVRAVATRLLLPNVIILDAHPDACDARHDAHATWVRRLWEEEFVDPKQTVFFGIRDPEAAEMTYVRKNGAKIFSAEDLEGADVKNIIFELRLHHTVDINRPLVLIVDIDVLDPVFAPGTGVLRSGGLNLRQAMKIIHIFGSLPFPVKIAEITEVIPPEGNELRPPHDKRPDPAGLTVCAAEAILREMIRSFS